MDIHLQDIDELKRCSRECKETVRQLKGYLDNVNYLSERKMKKCASQCEAISKDYSKGEDRYLEKKRQENDCWWVCYNKLDRRYRDYWLAQKNQLVDRQVFKQSSQQDTLI